MLQYYRDSETVSINNLKEYLYELCTILAKMPDYVCHGITDIYTVRKAKIQKIAKKIN